MRTFKTCDGYLFDFSFILIYAGRDFPRFLQKADAIFYGVGELAVCGGIS